MIIAAEHVKLGLIALAASAATYAQNPLPVKIAIESQPLDRAINAWAEQTGYQVLIGVSEADAARRTATRMEGTYLPEDALKILLASTGYKYHMVNPQTVAIRLADSEESSGGSPRDNTGNRVEEVVVTAQKRAERPQDVPVPVTALAASKLVENNLVKLQDYYNRVPGLNLATGNRGELFVSIRGLNVGWYTSPTVGILVDEVPFGSSTAITGGAPDIDPSELASIEVLRGPQGTLYGASSLGGLIKYVTIDPSTTRMTGDVQVGTSGVHGGDQLGWEARGSINVPVSSTFALRAGVFTRRDPGYIDNILANGGGRVEKDVNLDDAYGARLAAKWDFARSFSLKLSGLLQHAQSDGIGYSFLQPALGDLQQSYLIGAGATTRDSRVVNATVSGLIGDADLTSVSGYGDGEIIARRDISFLSRIPPASATIFGVPGLLYVEQNRSKKFSQEFRVASPLGSHLDALVGAFYTHEHFTGGPHRAMATDPATGEQPGVWGTTFIETTYEEYAAFADLTWKLSQKFDIQLGGRYSHDISTSVANITSGYQATAFFRQDPFSLPRVSSKNNPTTYLLTPRLKITPDLMIYGRIASGFRPGGPNRTFAAALGLPSTYGPDKTQNYEIGMKGELLSQALSFDLSVFRIDWKDIQLGVNLPIGSYVENAGRARSDGVELSLNAKPADLTTVGAWLSYNDATLTQDIPSNANISGHKGDQLPFTSRKSGNLSIDQGFRIGDKLMLSVGGALTYVGDRKHAFVGPTARRLSLPSYTEVDFRTELAFSSWNATLFVRNVTDRRGVLQSDSIPGAPVVAMYIQPRTIGMSLKKTF